MIEGFIGLLIMVGAACSWIFSSELSGKKSDGETGDAYENGGMKIRRVVSIDQTGRLFVDFAGAGGQLTNNVPVRIAGLGMPKGTDDAATWSRATITRMVFELLQKEKIKMVAANLARGKDGILEGDILVDGKSLLMSLNLSPYMGEQPEKKKPPKVEYIPVPGYSGFDQRQYDPRFQGRQNGVYFDNSQELFDRNGRRVG